MRSIPSLFIALALAAIFTTDSARSAEIGIPDNNTPATTVTQPTDITATAGGTLFNGTSGVDLAFVVTTMTFDATSPASRLRAHFRKTAASGDGLGLNVSPGGDVQLYVGAGVSGTLNLGSLAGKSTTFIMKYQYTGGQTWINVWANPDGTDVEGLTTTTGGDIRGYNGTANSVAVAAFNTQVVQTAGSSSVTNTTILTGADATFAKALQLATGASPSGIVDADASTVSASPVAVPADDITTSTITVTLKDTVGIPVTGKEVSLAGNGSATIETANNISDANGVVSFSVRSSTAGPEVFTATADPAGSAVAINNTASVNFQEVVPVGPVHAGNSTVVASSNSVIANGIITSTITVTLRDGNGQLVTGENVTLAGAPSVATISPSPTQQTDANGVALFTVKSTTIGNVVFTATSSTDNVTISQSASVNFTDPQDAQSFNVNFIKEGQADAANLVGVVGSPGETWNQGTTSVSNLVDTTGTVVSSVSISGLPSSGNSTTANLNIFDGNRNFFNKGHDATISITGLTPDAAYDIYIYSITHNYPSWGVPFDTERGAGDFVTTNTVLGNGQSQFLDNAMPGTSGSTFVPHGNYIVFQSIVADESGNISILADAYDGADGNPLVFDGDCRLHISGMQIRPASGTSADYMVWRDTYHPGLGLPDDDDDGDGLSNDYERIFGLDPGDPASSSPYSAPFDSGTGSFSYTRRASLLNNVNYKVWYSTDLGQWFEDNAANQLPISVSGDVEAMGVHIDPALLSEPKLFLQVRATPVTGVDIAPSLLNVRGSGNTITLLFSEPMNPSSASNPDNYAVAQVGAGALVITDAMPSSDGNSVTLTLASTLDIDTAYTVSVGGVTSGTGQSLGGQINLQFRTWDDDPAGVKVFILAGQSNMVGRGESERGNGGVNGAIGSLRYQVVNDNANYGQLVVDSGNPATDPWAVRGDVKVWWNRASIGGTTSILKGGLTVGFGSNSGTPSTDYKTIGPEYAFGWAVGDHLSQPVLIIKTAWGGKDLIKDFRPPSAVAARGGLVGGYYIQMIRQVREVLHSLGTQFPEWSGLGYQIAGFGWHQGWNDSLDTFAANEYEANMANFITDIRAEFGKPNLPFSIGTTGMEGAATGGSRLTVVNAQINVANPALHPELGGNVFTVDTRPFAETPENSPTDDTTHWKNNGKSMYRIGKGMGDGIVPLLAP